jgi:hypothetical protein
VWIVQQPYGWSIFFSRCDGCSASMAIYVQAYIHSKNTDEKEKKIFLIYKEIQKGLVAKSYMTDGLLMVKYLFFSSYIRKPHI